MVRAMERLKSCPFCGEKPTVSHWVDGKWSVNCDNPGCAIAPWMRLKFDTKAEAVAAWNRRACDD